MQNSLQHMKKLLLVAALSLAVLNAQSQCSTFYDGFESGAFSPTWVPGSGNYTNTVPNTGSAVGTYHLQMQSNAGNAFYQGLSATFTPSQPTYMSWWMKTNTTTAANGYVVIGNANITTDNGIIFCYFNSTSGLRFFASTGYNHPITANTWYHVEVMNMNWVSRTSDIYVNGVLILTAWPFRSTTATNIDRIHLHSLSVATAEYDEFLVGAPPVTATSTSSNILCFGGSNGSASVTASGGNGVYTYSWAPSGGTASTATGLTAGFYTCTITDGFGCTGTATFNLTEPTAVTATTSQTNVSCFGGNDGSATVIPAGGTPGYTYLWTPGGGTSATQTMMTAMCYTVTITDANGCTATQSVCITEPPQLMAMAANTGDVCAGDSTMLVGTAMGGTPSYSYNWLPGNITSMSTPVVPTVTTTYTLEVTDANGCTTSTTTTVTVNALPVVNLGADTTVCSGIMLDAQNSGSAYAWNSGDTTQMYNATASGNYYVTVTDMNGCVNSDSVMIAVDAMPIAGTVYNTSGADICVGDTSSLITTGSSGMIDWWVMPIAGPFWQYIGSGNPYTQSPPTPSDVGVYYFMAIASNGVCGPDTSNTITVEVHDLPIVDLGSDTASCGGVQLDAQNAGSTYAWSTGDSTQTVMVNASGTYDVWIVDQFGCANGDTVAVTINTPPVVTGMASANPVCMDDADVTLTGLPAGGLWTGPGVSGNMFDPSIGTGNQVLTYSYTDTNGCSGIYPLTVVVNACVGISEQAEVMMSVYPNPNNGTFTLQFAQASENVVIEITDVNGRVVSTQQLNAVSEGSTHEISMGDGAAGIYFMRVNAEENYSVIKIAVE